MAMTLQRERRSIHSPIRLIGALIAGAYFLWAVLHPMEWRLIDGVNLVIHEAGHIIFMPFGEFLMITGGSLLQVIIPAVFAAYFFYHNNRYACALVLLWVGESLINVSVYAGDAVVMQLPLLGGNDSMHDWNYLLDHLGWLSHTTGIAKALHFVAAMLIVAATVWAIKISLVSKARSTESKVAV